MLASEHYPNLFALSVLPKNELLEVHQSKISLHQAKTGYGHPTLGCLIRFQSLYLSTRIYQTFTRERWPFSLWFLLEKMPQTAQNRPSWHGAGHRFKPFWDYSCQAGFRAATLWTAAFSFQTEPMRFSDCRFDLKSKELRRGQKVSPRRLAITTKTITFSWFNLFLLISLFWWPEDQKEADYGR